MTVTILVILAFITLVLAYTFEAGIVYLWVFLSSLYVILEGISLVEGLQQGLYGAASIVCLPSMAIASLRRIGYLRKFRPFLLCVLGVSVAVLIAGFVHRIPIVDQLRSIGGMFVFVLMCFLCYSTMNDEQSFKGLLVCFTVVSIIVCGYALIDFLFLHKMIFVSGETRRATSLFITNSNVLASYGLFFFSLFTSLFLERKTLLYMVLSAFFLLCILITFSIAGIAGLFVCFLVIALFYKLYKKPLHVIYLGLAGMLSGIVLFVMGYIHSPSLRHVTTGGTILVRTERIWPMTLKLIGKSPMFGYTPNGGSALLGRGIERVSAHNEYLSLLLNYGVVGTVPILLFLLFVFVKLYRIRRITDSALVRGSSIGCLAYMLGAGVYGSAHSIGFSSTEVFPFWFISMALIGISEKQWP